MMEVRQPSRFEKKKNTARAKPTFSSLRFSSSPQSPPSGPRARSDGNPLFVDLGAGDEYVIMLGDEGARITGFVVPDVPDIGLSWHHGEAGGGHDL